jgi:hypothetical protein
VVINAERDNGDPQDGGPMFYTSAAQGDPSNPKAYLEYLTGFWYPGKGTANDPYWGRYYTDPDPKGQPITRYLNVTNAGTLECVLYGFSATLSVANDDANKDAYNDFANNLTVSILAPRAGTIWTRYLKTLLSGEQGLQTNPTPIGPGGSLDLQFEASLSTAAGNDLQGKSPVVNFYIYAKQAS